MVAASGISRYLHRVITDMFSPRDRRDMPLDISHLVQTNNPPNEEERRVILQKLRSLESSLESSPPHPPKKPKSRVPLSLTQEKIIECRAILSPIRILPPEIIGEIASHYQFVHICKNTGLPRDGWIVTEVKGRITNGPWRFGQICRLWRAVVLSDPNLWSKVHFTDFSDDVGWRTTTFQDCSVRQVPFLIEEGIRRSTSVGSDGMRALEISLIGRWCFKTCIPFLLEYASKWTSISIDHIILDEVERWNELQKTAFPALQHFSIDVSLQAYFDELKVLGDMPNIRSVQLGYIGVYHSRLIVLWENLTSLTFEALTWPGELKDCLSQCTRLQALTFKGFRGPTTQELVPIRHSSITSLDTSDTDCLPWLILPCLRVLSVARMLREVDETQLKLVKLEGKKEKETGRATMNDAVVLAEFLAASSPPVENLKVYFVYFHIPLFRSWTAALHRISGSLSVLSLSMACDKALVTSTIRYLTVNVPLNVTHERSSYVLPNLSEISIHLQLYRADDSDENRRRHAFVQRRERFILLESAGELVYSFQESLLEMVSSRIDQAGLALKKVELTTDDQADVAKMLFESMVEENDGTRTELEKWQRWQGLKEFAACILGEDLTRKNVDEIRKALDFIAMKEEEDESESESDRYDSDG